MQYKIKDLDTGEYTSTQNVDDLCFDVLEDMAINAEMIGEEEEASIQQMIDRHRAGELSWNVKLDILAEYNYEVIQQVGTPHE
jgi:hypothetical protein